VKRLTVWIDTDLTESERTAPFERASGIIAQFYESFKTEVGVIGCLILSPGSREWSRCGI